MSFNMASDDRESTISMVEAIAALTLVGEDGRVDVDLGLDPIYAETIGERLATLLAGHNASLVLSWAGENDTVLAHMVARRLGVPIGRTGADQRGSAPAAGKGVRSCSRCDMPRHLVPPRTGPQRGCLRILGRR